MFARLRFQLWSLTVCALAMLSSQALAFDGYVLSIRHEAEGIGNIHDGSTPGALVRYELTDGTVKDRKVLYNGKRCEDAVRDLFQRGLKKENG